MTVTDPEIRKAIRAVVDYNWSDAQADYQQQDAEDRQHHIVHSLSKVAAWLNETGHESQTNGRPDPRCASSKAPEKQARGHPGGYLGWIEWDLEEIDDPREAAEELWKRIRNSSGPVVELVDENGARLRVDLELEPGQGDVMAPDSGGLRFSPALKAPEKQVNENTICPLRTERID